MKSSKKSILLLVDPPIPIPPATYGGIERVVHLLAEGLKKKGYAVTLFCHPESTCDVNRKGYHALGNDMRSQLRNFGSIYSHLVLNRYDLIQSFANPDFLLPLWPLGMPVIQSFQSFPYWPSFLKRVRAVPRKNVHFTVCGHHMVKSFEEIAPTKAIHNGVNIMQYDFQPEVQPDAPFVFLGRLTPIKGAHTAIRIARRTGRKLVIAGNIPEQESARAYFQKEIEPELDDRIMFVGPVDDTQKNFLLGTAAALLMPIEWDEPFGIVMAEALACGTPVIGFSRGSVPEIVRQGITGACCDSEEMMVEAARQVDSFNRQACRADAETRFDFDKLTEDYIELYDLIHS